MVNFLCDNCIDVREPEVMEKLTDGKANTIFMQELDQDEVAEDMRTLDKNVHEQSSERITHALTIINTSQIQFLLTEGADIQEISKTLETVGVNLRPLLLRHVWFSHDGTREKIWQEMNKVFLNKMEAEEG